jgi:cytoskeletal protein CcmA (bactofilin family)
MRWRRARTGPGEGELTAFVDEGSEIEGKYAFRGTVMLNGRFAGEITTTDTLVVGEKAVVKATINAGIVRISGEVVGTVTASERIELRASARLYGDVETPVLVMDEGALLDGQCRMTRLKPAETSAAPARDLSVISGKRAAPPSA